MPRKFFSQRLIAQTNNTSDEERAFRVAWSAVKRDPEKGNDGNWHQKQAEQ